VDVRTLVGVLEGGYAGLTGATALPFPSIKQDDPTNL
jgi:hypothetical protein